MKMIILLPLIVLKSFFIPSIHNSTIIQTDTTTIAHLLDGNISEWPNERFQTDKEAKIFLASDNDDQFLFLALTISDLMTQRKIMQSGINLYIDVKGKKKENRGIEYPVLSDPGSMRLFGFSDSDPGTLKISTAGSVNIAFSWDNSNVMHIEYNIPLKMLDEKVLGLNNKEISVGWKLSESAMSNNNQNATVPSSGRNRAAAPSSTSSEFPLSTRIKYKSFWTTHTIIL